MFTKKESLAYIDPEKPRRIIVFGDVHGDLKSLYRGLSYWESEDLLLFLGDYADRGAHGVEVIERVDQLVRNYPQNVIALKGNHEEYDAEGRPTFAPCTLIHEAEKKKSSWWAFWPAFRSFVSNLFLTAYMPGFALFIHGGITSDIQSVEDMESPTQKMKECFLWSDPGEGEGEQPNLRGIGTVFGQDITESVLASIQTRYIIRSHEPRKARTGPYIDHNNRVVTTSSTSVYGGRPFILILETHRLPSDEEDFNDAVVFLDT